MPSLGAVRNKTLRDVAYESIKASIMNNESKQGEHLTIAGLANKLGISPTPVREAVVRLSNEGILDYVVNKSIRVSIITETSVKEIYEARRLLEIAIGKTFTDIFEEKQFIIEQLEVLRLDTHSLLKGNHNPDKYSSIDLKLHDVFIEIVQNSIIQDLFCMVGEKSLRIRTFVETTRMDGENSQEILKSTAREHLAIIEALLDCDKKRITRNLKLHLNNSEKRTLEALKRSIN